MGIEQKVHCLGKTGELVVVSDVHIGADTFDEVHFLETVDYCKITKCKIFLNGDIIENAIIQGSSPGEKLLEQKLIPTDQIKYATDLFKPLAKNIIGMTRGNHEARSRRESLVDISDLLAHSLGVPYLGLGGYIRVRAGSQPYTLALHHGGGGGVNTWKELDRLMGLYPSADLVGAGHDHNFCTREMTSLNLNEDGTEYIRVVHEVRTGTYLKYAEYARGRAYAPSAVGSPIITFNSNYSHIDVDVKSLRWYG